MRIKTQILISLLFITIILLEATNAKKKGTKGSKKKKPHHKVMLLREKETNPVKFIQLVVMRLIYGVATGLGFEENISEVGNGALVPPGADYGDDYEGGFFDDTGFGDDY